MAAKNGRTWEKYPFLARFGFYFTQNIIKLKRQLNIIIHFSHFRTFRFLLSNYTPLHAHFMFSTYHIRAFLARFGFYYKSDI